METQKKNTVNVNCDGRRMEEVKTCRYFGPDVSNDGRMGENKLYDQGCKKDSKCNYKFVQKEACLGKQNLIYLR